MISPDLKSWPPLLATVALLVAGAWIYQEGDGTTGAALLAAGLVTLGAWLALSIRGAANGGDHRIPAQTPQDTDRPPLRDEA